MFVGAVHVGKSLPINILWTAKISAMLAEDCGACVQLNITMALEAGVEKKIVQTIVKSPDDLDKELSLIYRFAKSVAENTLEYTQYQKQIEKKYTAAQLTELALIIASTKIYPTLKRALGDFQSCSLYQFNF